MLRAWTSLSHRSAASATVGLLLGAMWTPFAHVDLDRRPMVVGLFSCARERLDVTIAGLVDVIDDPRFLGLRPCW